MSERDQDQGGGQQPPIGQNDDQPKSEQDRQKQGQDKTLGQQDTLGAGQSGGFGNQTSGTPQREQGRRAEHHSGPLAEE